MDELAALMEEDASPSDDAEPSSDAIEGMDEFASLLEQDSNVDPSPPGYSRHSTTIETKRRSKPSSSNPTSRSNERSLAQPSAPAVASVGVDERLGIRMLNRQLSSLDLLDLITTTGPYHSPAQIGAMSLQALCGILVDPPSIVDRATVQGRTNLVTVGIVFENSGTKTSSKGGAFVILSIGSNLDSGPCFSVFLFGSAYSKYGKIRPGQVVAVSNPKLLPARDDNGGRSDTSLSLSVHDISQLVHVAKARDYGVCKASVGRKQPDGTWKSNAATCKTFIDTRHGDYCPFHEKKLKDKKGHITNCSAMRGMGGVSSSGSSGGKIVQEYKASKAPIDQSRSNTTGNRFLGNKSLGAVGKNVTGSLTSVRNSASSNTNNPYLTQTFKSKSVAAPNAPVSGNVSHVPMHMKKDDPRQMHRQTAKRDNSVDLGNANRFTGKSTKRKASEGQQSEGPTASKKEKTSLTSHPNDWLQEAASRRPPPKSLSSYLPNNDGKKMRRVNNIGCNFDGSVPVPKPSKALFASQGPKVSRSFFSSATTEELNEREANKIKENQAIILEKMLKKSGAPTDKAAFNRTASGLAKAKAKMPSSSGNAFLDSIQIDDVDAVLNAKSKFASEAAAEDYVKRRRRLVELEGCETKEMKRQSAKQDKENQMIQTVWICHTCPNKPRFNKKPMQCIRECHRVKKERHIKESTSKLDERTKLHEKGGLTLGSGLEWSKNPYNQLN